MMLRTTFEPTDHELIERMKQDPIARNEQLRYFVKLIDANDGGLSMFLNGAWGCGKTYFVRQAQLLLRALNGHLKTPEGLSRQDCEDILWDVDVVRDCQKTYLPVYFNSWENDSFGEPVLSLMSDIADMEDIKQDAQWDREAFKSLINDIAKCVPKGALPFGADIAVEITEDMFSLRGRTPDPLQEYQDRKKLKAYVGKLIDKARDVAAADAVVVFVDELDRCRPSYAIEVLESVKHLLVRTDVFVVFSLDATQLAEVIRGAYGTNFDAERYLRRFYDVSIRLPEVHVDEYVGQVLGRADHASTVFDQVAHDLAKSGELVMRDIVQLYESFDAIRQNRMSVVDLLDTTVFYAIAPLACYLQLTQPTAWELVIQRGNVGKEVIWYANSIPSIANMLDRIIGLKGAHLWDRPAKCATQYDAREALLGDLLLAYAANENVPARRDAVARVRDAGTGMAKRRDMLRVATEQWTR